MSERWTPTVGDEVIYNGEHMILASVSARTCRVLDGDGVSWWARPTWVTPVTVGADSLVSVLDVIAARTRLQRRIDRALDVLSAPWEGDSAADRLDHVERVLRADQ